MAWIQGDYNSEMQDFKQGSDQQLFTDYFSLDEDSSSDDVPLDGLHEELKGCSNDDVPANIFANGTNLQEYTRGVESNLRRDEQGYLETYIEESDNLVLLHGQFHDCEIILSQIGSLLGGFQVEIGSISAEIKSLQEKSMEMGMKLKNRKLVELKLAKFIEEIIAPPSLVTAIIDGEVNEEYLRHLEVLSKKLKFVGIDYMLNASEVFQDVQQEMDRLRQTAVAKVFDFIIEKIYSLRKPKTNIQMLQQNSLLKYRYLILFLKEHGKEKYPDILAAYIDTMNKVLSVHFFVYIEALERLQMNMATPNDLFGSDSKSLGVLLRVQEHSQKRSSIFALGERINILKEVDQPALVPHISEANALRYPYEALFRSLHKLLIDTSCSEYLFLEAFFGEASLLYEIFAGAFTVIDEHLKLVLPNCYDAICLMLMICITRKHQVIMSRRRIPCLDSYFDKVNIFLWPCFKKVIDMHLQCLKNCDVKTLWEDDTHPHYAIRCYAEFAASLIQLNVEYGNNQLDMNLEQLHMAIDNLLVRLAERFRIPKSQALFLLNNYDMIIAVLKEAGDIGKIPTFFEEKLESNISLFVEELLSEHFTDLIKFVKAYDDEESTSFTGSPTIADVEPLVKDFAMRWKAVLEAMHKDVITSFSNLSCGMEILKAAMAQLLNYYNSLSECVKMIPRSSTLNKYLVSITSISYEIRKYSRTF
ncbi:vacuolar protein sorting-associated protein 52 A-like isoform X2 [Ananas comosus]|uniref:Vacuolar protein sorting-associated protein 52 A-like isoform X2 n=1 Tax=Ananas comosus TaxID=4615 RepID=A0A6P5ESG5_ANACO|nr:vacuolar protein sorting-associated protein 52 A-like isoform X2 [Ananas comosus]